MARQSTLRPAQIERARAALVDGRMVIVVGPRGSGRTSFGAAVVSALDPEARERVWFGDDVERLDDDRATRVARAAESGKVAPFLTSVGGALPEPLERLRDDRAVSIELERLCSRDLLRAAETWLGGPMDPATVSALVPVRGGWDLVLLRAAITTARAGGLLAEVDGFWRVESPHRSDPGLRSIVETRLSGLRAGNAGGTLLELIALAPDLTIRSLAEATRRLEIDIDLEPVLEALEDEGVIDVSVPGEPRIRLRDGVIELFTAQTMKALKRRRLCGVIVDVLENLPFSQLNTTELQILADYSLALSRSAPPELVRRAAVASFRNTDTQLTHRLAAAAVDLDPNFDAEMTLAAAESQSGRAGDALARLEHLVSEAGSDLERSQALRALTTIVAEQAGDPYRTLALHRAALSASAPQSSAELHLNASKGFMLYALGDSVGAAELIEPAVKLLEGEALPQAYFVIGNSALLRGSLSRAHETLDAGQAVLEAAGIDSSTMQLQRAFVMSFEGRLAEALAIVERFRAAASTFGQWAPQALCTWAIGGLLLSSGRAPEAVDELRTAIAVMERIGTQRTALLVRTDLARALAVAGDPAAARNALEPAVHRRASVFDVDAKGLQSLAWIEAAEGELAESAADFIRAADAYALSGHALPELLSLHEAARAGAGSAVLDRASAIADGIEGHPAALALRHVRALASCDTSAMSAEQGREFAEIGHEAAGMMLHLIASEAFATAASIHAATGDARRAAADDRLRGEQLALCGIARSPLVPARTNTPLSDREIELASLASAGLSNRQIAAKLVLSVRTVETHLQRVYTKLGVRSRAELPEALARLPK